MSDERREWELPEDKRDDHRRAVRLEWLTIAYLISAVVVIFLTLGQSQAMKAAWIEDMLSLLPPIAFLAAARIRRRAATDAFPWGRHRSVSLAYLGASVALLVVGSLLFFDSGLKLVKAEHPPIGLVEIFGQDVWLGWLMLPALVWSAIPAFLLGRAKLKLADALHDKVLYADAEMNRADWMTATAAIIGVLGIGIGLWWMDAVAALFISQDIIRDGLRNVRAAGQDLMDARPRRHDSSAWHPVVEEIEEELRKADWIEEGAVRLREEGHVFAGEVLVVPKSDERLLERCEELADHLLGLSWILYDVVVVPVEEVAVPAPSAPSRHREAKLED